MNQAPLRWTSKQVHAISAADRAAQLRSISTKALHDATSGRLSERSTIHAAFNAGYVVLSSVVDADVVAQMDDHPSMDLIKAGCRELGIGHDDEALAAHVAGTYYQASDLQVTAQQCIAWAQRLRHAAGFAWASSPSSRRPASSPRPPNSWKK